MFKTKFEVDKHVDSCLKKINNETERNLRCFSFAKLYFNVGAYEQSVRYINSYLSCKPKSPEGHYLLGRALEKLGKKEAALEAYRMSLQQDPKQNNLIMKVCELMAQDDVELDQSGARYFCNLAQSLDPQNPIVFSLKERLLTNESENPQEVVQCLLKELESRPTDVNLRVRLLKHFLQNNMIKAAYKHASDIEDKKLDIFHNNLAWYEVLAEVLVRYQRDSTVSSQLTWEFWFLSVSVLDKLAALSLDEHLENFKSTVDYTAAVFNFDQTLLKASESVSGCPDSTLRQVFLSHYEAQLHFHLAVLAFKQAKKDLITFKDAVNLTLPVWLMAYHTSPPDLRSMWFNSATETKRRQICQWHKEASYRCSQAGHILVSAAKDRKSIILEKAKQYSSGIWKEQFFKKLFVKRDQHMKLSTSFFVSNTGSSTPTIKLPDGTDLIGYDEIAQTLYPDSLHHYIWMLLNYKLTDFSVKSFEGLQYTIKNLSNCGAETLNILDIQTFICCATNCAKSKLEESKPMIYYNQDRPALLPASITANLGTINQAKFISAAFKMYKNEQASNLGEIRLLLVKGIEVVRCVGHHGQDVKLMVNLADIFTEKCKIMTKQAEIEGCEARAELYWKAALPLLEKIKNNQAVVYPNNRLFEYKGKEMSQNEATSAIERGKLFIAVQLMKKKEYERSMSILEQLKDPYASFHQSQIYKLMADQKTMQNKGDVTSEMRSQNIILLSRARDCLYLTLDRLREPSMDRDHPLNAQLGTEIEKIERLLSRIDPDCNNRNECDGMSDVSSDNSVGEHYLSTYTHTSFHNGTHYGSKHESHQHSTPLRFSLPRQEARPSPERLDAQIRQLIASKDNTVSEQSKMIVDLHKSLLEEFRGFKDVVKNLTSTVDERLKTFFDDMKGVKKSVDDLKTSVDDIQTVNDMVQEMKREINELKKEIHKNPTQLSEEDLYVLDPDYNSALDYNINSASTSSMNPMSQLYSHYPGVRLPQPPPNAMPGAYPNPAAVYPGLYPGLPYPFGGLGLPHQAAFLPPEQQLQHLNALNSLAAAQQLPPVVGGLPMISQQTSNSQLSLGQLSQPSSSFSQLGSLLSQSSVQSKESPKIVFSSSSVSGVNPSIFGASAPTLTPAVSTSKAPPVNVVITSSDPLPTSKTTTTQPILSVTIPPQHIKGNTSKPASQIGQQPHNYQIPMPVSSGVTQPSILSAPAPVISTSSLLTNVPSPVVSAVKSPIDKNLSLGQQIEKALDQTFSPSKNDTSLNRTNVSTSSVEEYDPRPDFKPIIPLPDEVPVTTGEEKETELFCQRGKLFRHVNTNGVREWRERGVGNLKILLNPDTGKVRLIMRRDQVHKICANHFITKEMSLSPMPNNDRAYVWAANDFAEEQMQVEKFCVRFKTSEEARKFNDAFELAKTKIVEKPSSPDENSNKDASRQEVTEDTEVPKASTVNTPSLGGFVFSGTTTPTFKPKEEIKPEPVKVVEVKESTPKSSPFANFTFGSTPQPGTKLTFGSLPSEPVKFAPNDTQVASSTPQKAVPEVEEGHEDSRPDEFVPTADFKPVVDLPDLVEVKTGEENAEVLFEERGKLFRYDTNGDTKEWKERGVGVVKILKEDTVRIVMRRDQVHKVCCNHQVLKSMSFKQTPNNPKAVLWACKDFSEGVLSPETFTIRFKNEEIASRFLKTVEAAQTSMDENSQIISGKPKPEPAAKTGFGDKFKPTKGSWECKNCYIVNDSKTNKCVACETPKSGSVTKSDDQAGTTFSFGLKHQNQGLQDKKESSGFGDAFKPKAGTWECKQCYIRNEPTSKYCLSCESPKDDSVPKKESSTALKGVNLETPGLKFTFGVPPAGSSTAAPVPSGTNFAFGDPGATKATFSWKPATTESDKPVEQTTNSEDKDKFVFGSPQKHDFEFKPRSPRRISSGQGDESDGGEYVEEEVDNIYFKPVVPLPEKVEVKTGEEGEDVLYCHRAKLFRFIENEWKERGIGDVKILKERTNGKLRVLMRREQVLKVCLNHWLTLDVEYKPKDEKTWLFYAADFSEGEISREQFCLRFKNEEIAKKFKTAIEDALKGGSSVNTQDPSGFSKEKTTDQDVSDSEVEFISETLVSAEDQAAAIKLGLPPKFFAYKQLPDCTCEQCKKDDEYLNELFLKDKKIGVNIEEKTTSVFGSPLNTSSIFGTPQKSETVRDLLKKPSWLASSNSGTPKTAYFTPPEGSGTATFTFGTPGQTLFGQNSNNIFKTGATNIFGASNTSGTNIYSDKSSIFGGTTPKSSPSVNIFGGAASSETPKDSPIFAASTNSKDSPSVSIFGSTALKATQPEEPPKNVVLGTQLKGEPAKSQDGSKNLFGGGNNIFKAAEPSKTNLFTPTTNIFSPSGTTNSGTSLFGNAKVNLFGTTPSTTGTTNIFSQQKGSIFSNSNSDSSLSTMTSTTGSGTSIFGGGASSGTSLFGGTPGIFGGTSGGSLFGAKTAPLGNPSMSLSTTLKENDKPVLDCDTGLSFASLAAKVDPAFKEKEKKEDKNAFAFLGAGAPVFGGAAKKEDKEKNKKKDESLDNEGEEEAGDTSQEYDPYYEPIVPLPDQIVVTTGEENEQILFNERAKLFRFDSDNHEWKERGVGQIKILYHPNNGTYRLLLRREQVHKVVLNQRILPELELQPMSTSDKAWMWVGHNYTDDTFRQEKLAVRFKNVELAQQFFKAVQDAVEKVKKIQANKSQPSSNDSSSIPLTVQQLEDEDPLDLQVNPAEHDYEGNYEDEEDEDEDEEDLEDDRSIMFSKRCTLSEQTDSGVWQKVSVGELQVYYDSELYVARICLINDDGEQLTNTLIGLNTNMQLQDKECWWKGVEWLTGTPTWRTLKATFANAAAAQEFHSSYLEGINFAEEVGMLDEMPPGEPGDEN